MTEPDGRRHTGHSGSDNEMQMHTPVFKWEWNINTALLLTVAGAILAVGYFVNDVVRMNADQAGDINRIDMRLDRFDLELRSIPNHELRITANERAITSIAADNRDVAEKVNDLATDARVIREIVERIEASQRRGNGVEPTSYKKP